MCAPHVCRCQGCQKEVYDHLVLESQVVVSCMTQCWEPNSDLAASVLNLSLEGQQVLLPAETSVQPLKSISNNQYLVFSLFA